MRSYKVILIPFVLSLMLSACSSDSNKQNNKSGSLNEGSENTDFQLINLSETLSSLSVESLSDEEVDAILFMREEEKLARDAYRLFYQLWNQKIFTNIASAEQTHMDALLLLIDRYQLIDPVSSDDSGVFENSELQNLYDVLAAKGSNSLIDALMAGAEIEEVDLLDLELRALQSDNEDVQLIFESLMKGSRNHLRSFVSNLENQHMSYAPQHLTQEEFDEIINSPMESGNEI